MTGPPPRGKKRRGEAKIWGGGDIKEKGGYRTYADDVPEPIDALLRVLQQQPLVAQFAAGLPARQAVLDLADLGRARQQPAGRVDPVRVLQVVEVLRLLHAQPAAAVRAAAAEAPVALGFGAGSRKAPAHVRGRVQVAVELGRFVVDLVGGALPSDLPFHILAGRSVEDGRGDAGVEQHLESVRDDGGWSCHSR